MADEQHSLPLAPPSAIAHRAAQTPLSNADFRKLLSTPRPGRAVARAGAEADQRGGAAPREKKPFRPKAKPAGAEEGDGGDSSLAYRDRAAERRDNANPDYEGLSGSLGAVRAPSSGFALGVPVAAALTVEETRYLGGDLEHTHLVKGLDYALLHKARQAARLEGAGERSEEARPRSDNAAAPPTVHTSLGRAIHAFITGQQRHSSAAVERIAQGRVAFLFDLELDTSGNELPATLLRSRATDDAETADAVLCAPDAPLLLRASEAFGRLRSDASLTGKKLRRKEKALEPSASHALKVPAAMACATADDEEDIFADAGRTYVCEPSKLPPAQCAFAAAPGPYFGAETPHFGAEVPQPLTAADVPAQAGVAHKPAPAVAAERLRKLQELDGDSAYGDLYPGDGGYGFDLAGSDDEGVVGEGASKAKATKPPKDGAKARDAKLSSQLQDVRRALAEKHGEKFEGAFAKRSADAPPVDDAVGEAKARAKRLRL